VHHLQTTLTPAQETIVVHLRKTQRLSLDDLLNVSRQHKISCVLPVARFQKVPSSPGQSRKSYKKIKLFD